MRKSSFSSLFIAFLLLSSPVFSQQPDRLFVHATLSKDSVPSHINWDQPAANKVFTRKNTSVPVAMIAYGFFSLKSDWPQDWNEAIRKGVWIDNPHKEVHIDNYLQYSPAVAVYALNLAGIKGKNNLRDRTFIYALTTAIVTSTVLSLKSITKEERPDGSNRGSFPSGHTTTAFAAAEFLRQEYKDVSPWYGIAGYAAATATGYLRVYNNKHWAGDVIAGAGFGILSTKLAYYVYPAIKRALFKPHHIISTAL